MKKDPQWDFDVMGCVEPVAGAPVVVALDPAKSTGWAVLELTEEPAVHHGQCPIDHLDAWLLPFTEDRPCLVVVERGYISHPPPTASEATKIQSERSQMKFFERCGRVLEFANQNLSLAAPVWRPNAKQWRKRVGAWPSPPSGLDHTARRKHHKRVACELAAAFTGDPFTKQAHWFENNMRRFKTGVLLDDEADATCQAIAGLKLFTADLWPQWSEVDD